MNTSKTYLFFMLLLLVSINLQGQNQVDVVVHYVQASENDGSLNAEFQGCFANYSLAQVQERMCEAETFYLTQGIDLDFCYQAVCDTELYYNDSNNAVGNTAYHTPGALNIYVKNGGQALSDGEGSEAINTPNMDAGIGYNTLIHEIGHALGLGHTDKAQWTLDDLDPNNKIWTTGATIDADTGGENGVTDTYPSPSSNSGGPAPLFWNPATNSSVSNGVIYNEDCQVYEIQPGFTLLDANGTMLNYNAPGYDNLSVGENLLRNPMEQRYCATMTYSPEGKTLIQNYAAANFTSSNFAGTECSDPLSQVCSSTGTIAAGQTWNMTSDSQLSGRIDVYGRLELKLADYYFSSDAEIVVHAGGELLAWAATLQSGNVGCLSNGKPWKGITVLEGGSAEIYGSNLKDASMGIYAEDPALFDMHNSTADNFVKIELVEASGAKISASSILDTNVEIVGGDIDLLSNMYLGNDFQFPTVNINSGAVARVIGSFTATIFQDYNIDIDGSDVRFNNAFFVEGTNIIATNSDLSLYQSYADYTSTTLVKATDCTFYSGSNAISGTGNGFDVWGENAVVNYNYFDMQGNGNAVFSVGTDFSGLNCNIFDGTPGNMDLFLVNPGMNEIGSPDENAGNQFLDGEDSYAIDVYGGSGLTYYHGVLDEEDINVIGFNGMVTPEYVDESSCGPYASWHWDWNNILCRNKDDHGNYVPVEGEGEESCCLRKISIYVGCPESPYYERRKELFTKLSNKFPGCVELKKFCRPNEFKGLEQIDVSALYDGDISSDESISGIENQNIKAVSYKVFPNPVYDVLSVEIPDYKEGKEFHLFLYDMNGKLVRKINPKSTLEEIQMAEMVNGVYNLVLRNKDEILLSERVVITK